ncbi:MAG: TIGR03960 family B12-binding radical SAM protein, partial [Clostridiales bacterium]|nr:TIGR03960 family B12-binding radical SAM protein [Clostridiales bacterium]
APIIDFFMIGDGEEVLPEVCRVHKEWKESGEDREGFLKRLSAVEGVYVPRFYEHVYDDAGKLIEIKKIWEGAPDKVNKRIVKDLNAVTFPKEPLVPFIQVVHDRAVTEIFRGCTRGCRFCQAGMIYRPVRERTKEQILDIAKAQLAATGHEEISFLSLSTSDHSKVEELVTEMMALCKEKNVALSLPSLRLDSFSFKVLEEIQGYRKTGLTFAPEAGTQRLRDVINKGITEENIMDSIAQAMELGWNSIKLYFMGGLPTETYEDLDGIADIARKIIQIWRNMPPENKIGRPQITVSLSNFVPKAHTPFQWMGQDSQENLNEKHAYLKEKLKTLKAVHFQYHDTRTSYIEAVLARGDRRLADALIRAWELGCKFDGWRERFHYDKWVQAFADTGLDADSYAYREFADEDVLPWDLIDSGVTKSFFLRERDLALKECTTGDCRQACRGCGINKRTECFTGREVS